MPIKIPAALPAFSALEGENIFVMPKHRAETQDIRPLKIVLLNLMPTKIVTETQILRALSNSPLQIEVDLLQTSTYRPKNISEEHLLTFYNKFDEISSNRYDGMIVTGAPVETSDFEKVAYWSELCEILDWSAERVQSAFHICWGAQAGLYRHYGVPKHPLEKKMFGVFEHSPRDKHCPLTRGFDDVFLAPHSRRTEVREADIALCKDLKIRASSERAGVYIIASDGGRRVFVTGHSEYDAETLGLEYFRDVEKGEDIQPPENYFTDDNPALGARKTWRSHAHLLYANWLNYYVYQATPYDLNAIG